MQKRKRTSKHASLCSSLGLCRLDWVYSFSPPPRCRGGTLFVRSNRLLPVNATGPPLDPLLVAPAWFDPGGSPRLAMATLRPRSSASNPARETASFSSGTEGILGPVNLVCCILLLRFLSFQRSHSSKSHCCFVDGPSSSSCGPDRRSTTRASRKGTNGGRGEVQGSHFSAPKWTQPQ